VPSVVAIYNTCWPTLGCNFNSMANQVLPVSGSSLKKRRVISAMQAQTLLKSECCLSCHGRFRRVSGCANGAGSENTLR
jgi:hypothetical protein